MKSLFKALDILEYVILRNGANVTPSQAAEALGVNLVTCTRIMQAWTERGYLVNVSRKSGYGPGPMIASVGMHENAYRKLAVAAAGPVAELAQRLNRKVNLAVMHRGRRVMLNWKIVNSTERSWPELFFSRHWRSATGRLLLAFLPPAEAREILRKEGVTPFPAKELAVLRKTGIVCFAESEALNIVGSVLRIPGYPIAALGFGAAPERTEEALKATRQTIEKIRNVLTAVEADY